MHLINSSVVGKGARGLMKDHFQKLEEKESSRS